MRTLASLPGLAAAAVLLSSCQTSSTPAHMQTHYQRVGAVQSGVVNGDLAQAKDAARWVAEHERIEGLPATGAPFVTQMQTAAAEVARAGTTAEAALATARMGATCGSCHRATNANYRVAVITQPERSPSAATSRMLGHYWAADRMWEGLVVPSDTSWQAGAHLLADPARYENLLSVPAARASEVQALAAQLRTLGQRAAAASGQADRSAIYGEVLATCNGCHQMLNVRVR